MLAIGSAFGKTYSKTVKIHRPYNLVVWVKNLFMSNRDKLENRQNINWILKFQNANILIKRSKIHPFELFFDKKLNAIYEI